MTSHVEERIKYIINKNADKNKTAVITCSCLKKKYRRTIEQLFPTRKYS